MIKSLSYLLLVRSYQFLVSSAMPLADFIFTDVQQRVLAATYLDPDAWHSFSDIKRATGSHGATQSFIRALLRAGALEDRIAGNQHQYRANREFPLYPEIRS